MVGDFNPHRWMRPHPTFPSRDAWGRFAPLRSGVVTLLPAYASTWWDRAPCFFMDGHECFDDSYCDCHPTRANTFAGPSGGCCETPECRKMVTAIGDCHVYSGNQFPPFLSCRQTNQRGVLTVQATAERMRQIITVRLGAIGVCHANALIPATARVITSSCLGSFYGSWLAAHPQGPSPPGVLQRR